MKPTTHTASSRRSKEKSSPAAAKRAAAKRALPKKRAAPKRALPKNRAAAPNQALPKKRAGAPKRALPKKRAAAKRAVAPKRALPKNRAAAPERALRKNRTAAPKRAAARRPANATASRRLAPRRGGRPTGRAPASRWLRFVEQHGVVLASARGPVPCVAEAVAGQPIVGSWWAHPKGKAIFAALSELDDSDDVRCFKLVDSKVTFVHRRVWPALARLAAGGVIAPGRVASIQQEHMPTGEHRNLVTPFPDWVPDDVARASTTLSLDDARAQLGAWV